MKRTKSPWLPCLLLGMSLSAAPGARALDGTWTGTASANWDDATTGPWAGGVVAGGGQFTATFSSDIAATTTVTLTANRDIANLVFSDNGAPGSSWTLSNSNNALLTLAGATSTITAITPVSIGAPLAAAAGFSKEGAAALTLTGTATGIAGPITINAGSVLTALERLGTATINANGAYGATYTSAGTPFLRITNTTNQVMTNSLVVAAPGSTSYYAIQKSGTTSSLELGGVISGGNANSILQLDTATGSDSTTSFIVSGNNTVAGQIRLNRGRLTLANANALGTASLFLQTNANATNGNLSFSGVSGFGNNLIIGTTTNQWIDTGAGAITLTGVVSSATSASGGFSKMGAGTLTFTGDSNTYNGSTTTIADGTLSISGAGRLHSAAYSGALVLTAATSVFDYASSTSQTISGAISGLGRLTKSGTSTLTLSSATNSYAGGITINQGRVIVSAAAALGAGTVNANSSYGATYTSGGTPFLAASTSGLTIGNNIVLSPTAGYYALQMGAASGGTVTWSGIISGGGAGTILQIDTPNSGDSTSMTTLSGNNSFAGTLRLNRGNLTLANASAAGTADLFIQTPTNATTGNLVFSNGFSLANNIALGVSTAGTTSPGISTGANDVVLSGILSGVPGAQGTNAGFTKLGAGSLTLAGLNTYTGSTAVSEGSLTLADDAQLKFVIGANGVNNAITGVGALALNGDFNFDLSAAGAALGNFWQIVANDTLTENYSSSFSVFSGVTPFVDNGNDTWSFTKSGGIEYTFAESTGTLTVKAVPEPGTVPALAGGAALLLGLRRRRRAA